MKTSELIQELQNAMDKHGDLDVFKEGYEFGYKVHYCMTTVQILNRDEVLDVFPEFKGDKNIVIS